MSMIDPTCRKWMYVGDTVGIINMCTNINSNNSNLGSFNYLCFIKSLTITIRVITYTLAYLI